MAKYSFVVELTFKSMACFEHFFALFAYIIDYVGIEVEWKVINWSEKLNLL